MFGYGRKRTSSKNLCARSRYIGSTQNCNSDFRLTTNTSHYFAVLTVPVVLYSMTRIITRGHAYLTSPKTYCEATTTSDTTYSVFSLKNLHISICTSGSSPHHIYLSNHTSPSSFSESSLQHYPYPTSSANFRHLYVACLDGGNKSSHEGIPHSQKS